MIFHCSFNLLFNLVTDESERLCICHNLSEAEFLKLFPDLEDPVLLLSTGKNNSLPAALEIKTFCGQNHKGTILLTGNEE